MATQPKVNPILPNEARHFNGKSITALRVTIGVAVAENDTNFGPNGIIQRVYEVIQANATPIIYGHVDTTDGSFDVYLEGDFHETDDYALGDNSFVGDLAARIQALGTVETVDASGATVALVDTLVDDHDGNAGLVGDGGFEI